MRDGVRADRGLGWAPRSKPAMNCGCGKVADGIADLQVIGMIRQRQQSTIGHRHDFSGIWGYV